MADFFAYLKKNARVLRWVTMKLILLYGAPAVGKLSISRELEKMTGFKMLQNHLIADLIASLFGYGNAVTKPLNFSVRMLMFEAAMKNGLTGLISTFVYYDKDQDDYIRKISGLITNGGGKLHLVRLYCEPEELMRRVVGTSRQGTTKLTDREKLKEILDRSPKIYQSLPDDIGETFVLDNSSINPLQAAEMIKERFNL